jgi:hypothetical protein
MLNVRWFSIPLTHRLPAFCNRRWGQVILAQFCRRLFVGVT